MRPKLRHPLRERSPERPARRGDERRTKQRRSEPRVIVMDAEPSPSAVLPNECDRAAEQVRRAGGPLDVAVYNCGCGYLFTASVSTTVACPHCGVDQAWYPSAGRRRPAVGRLGAVESPAKTAHSRDGPADHHLL